MNPFVFGKCVEDDEHFINREQELVSLKRDMLDSEKIFLISPRRYGKTSLIRKAMKELEAENNVKSAYVDLFKCSTTEQMVGQLAKAVSNFETTKMEKAMQFIRDIIPQLRPKFSVDNTGELSVTIDSVSKVSETNEMLERSLGYAQNYCDKANKKAVIVFDEFQEIDHLGGVKIEKLLRSIVQMQGSVSYVFSGSKKHLLLQMINSQKRAFYGIGPTMHLKKINAEKWMKYLKMRFKKGNYAISEDTIEYIISKARNVPYYVQCLSHEVWDAAQCDKVVNNALVDAVIESIMSKHGPAAEGIWGNLPAAQKGVLEIISRGQKDSLYDTDTLLSQQIKSRQSAQKAVELLKDKSILEDNEEGLVIADVWFEEWIRHEMK